MGSRFLPVLWVFLLAGCLAQSDPASTSPPPPSEAPTVEPVSAPILPNETSAADADYFEWSNSTLTGPFAGQLSFTLPTKSSCEIVFAQSVKSDRWGPTDFMTVDSASGSGWVAGSSGHYAQVHAGSIDTRSTLGPNGGGAGRATFTFTGIEGKVRVLFAASNLAPWEGGAPVDEWLPNGAAIRLTIECGVAFQMGPLEGGRAVLLYDQNSMHGGYGASVAGEFSVAANDGVAAKFQSSHVLSIVGHFGYEAGRVTLRHPKGTVDCDLTPISFAPCKVEGGPGEWGATLTRVAANFDAFWGAIVGLDPVASFNETAPLASA